MQETDHEAEEASTTKFLTEWNATRIHIYNMTTVYGGRKPQK